MKKKKEIPSASTVAVSDTSDLKSSIRNHSAFFDELIELIPARFYLPTDDDDGGSSKPWFQGLSRTAKAAAKKQTRENLKKARRDRLDPETPQFSTLDKLLERNERPEDDDVEDEDGGDKAVATEERDRSVTYEELRQRLHCRIEALRGNRGSESTSRKRKQENQRQRDIKEGRRTDVEKSEATDVAEAAEGVEFGKVKLVEDDDEKNKRRKLSKGKMLEKAQELEQAKRDPEKGGEVAKKHSWKAAVSRAAGVKVHDNPKLLKQSMHKDKKRQEKNAEKWKERVASRDKMKADKQQKRAGNISERIQQTKMRKIAKREKKLMRPGFEGRKQGYINQ